MGIVHDELVEKKEDILRFISKEQNQLEEMNSHDRGSNLYYDLKQMDLIGMGLMLRKLYPRPGERSSARLP